MGYQNVNAPFIGKDACSLLQLGLVHTDDDSDPLPPQSLLRPHGEYHIHKTIFNHFTNAQFRTLVKNISLDKSTRMIQNAPKKATNVDALEEGDLWNGSNQKTATLFKVHTSRH